MKPMERALRARSKAGMLLLDDQIYLFAPNFVSEWRVVSVQSHGVIVRQEGEQRVVSRLEAVDGRIYWLLANGEGETTG